MVDNPSTSMICAILRIKKLYVTPALALRKCLIDSEKTYMKYIKLKKIIRSQNPQEYHLLPALSAS